MIVTWFNFQCCLGSNWLLVSIGSDSGLVPNKHQAIIWTILAYFTDAYIRHSTSTTRWRHQMETLSALLAIVRGIHRSPVNSPHKGQWRGALMFSLICTWINGWVNNGEAGDLRRHRDHFDVIVLSICRPWSQTIDEYSNHLYQLRAVKYR